MVFFLVLNCEEMCPINLTQKELNELIKDEGVLADQPSEDFRNALRDLEANIPAQKVSLEPTLLVPLSSTHRTLSVSDRKDRKFKLLAVPLKRTTHRSDALFRNSETISQASTSYSSTNQATLTTQPLSPSLQSQTHKSATNPNLLISF